jgi:hypothetical protein
MTTFLLGRKTRTLAAAALALALITPAQAASTCKVTDWPAPGSEDTELGVLMEPEVGHGETEVYARVQA